MDNEERVVLTDKDGHDLLNPDGSVRTMDKMEAHRRGLRHRAVSLFVFNSRGDLLLQRRAFDKYHSPGKWTNTCCTHCHQGEIPSDTAIRRLREEMGLQCILREVFTFPYHADVGNGMIENEFDHVFIGQCDENPTPDATEILDWKWMAPASIQETLVKSPEQYTYWLRYCFAKVLEYVGRQRAQGVIPRSSEVIAPPDMVGKTCFIICPLSKEHIETANRFCDEIVRPVIVELGFNPVIQRADVTRTNPNIATLVNEKLIEADLVVADLTGANANVFYELGKRHALGGMRVQFTRDPLSNLPFDIRQIYTIHYDLCTAETIDRSRQEFRAELAGQMGGPPRALALSPAQVADRFGVTVLVKVVTKDREQYALATGLARKRCKRIFLMQRSSTMLLGPHRDWEDEKTFYELLFQQIADGVEMYHIVSLEGISRHYVPSEYPERGNAMARLVCQQGFVGVDGPAGSWPFKKTASLAHDKDIKPDRQARMFLAELEGNIAEGVLVTDFGDMPASFHMTGGNMLNFMSECIKYYERCPKLIPQDIKAIR